MANTLTDVMPKILARGLLALREQAIMPRLINLDYGTEAAEKGDTIDIPLSSALTATDVTPSQVPPAAVDSTPTKVQIQLNKWKQARFHLTDKEMTEIDRNEHFMPLQSTEAIRALANKVNEDVLATYTEVYGYDGTAGTTPFATTVAAAVNARKRLHTQLTPRQNRRAVLDYDAEANALSLAQFADAEKTGDGGAVKIEGEIGRKYGIDWFTDDQIPTHTAGTAGADADTIAVDNGAGYALGVKSMNVDVSAGTSTFVIGDIFTIAGDTQTYVCTNADTLNTTGVTVSFEPGLQVAVADDAVIDFKETHVVNLAFHRDAFAFANRPLMQNSADLALGSRLIGMTDPQTGISLRLEVSRQHKQVCWDYDILYGVKCVRPAMATRIAG